MSRQIRYYLLDPTGNYTILVETPVPPEEQPGVAARLMELEPNAEQVGFIKGDGERAVNLRMAGGEFCGNAAMSAALVHAIGAKTEETDVSVRFSGANISVNVRIENRDGGSIGTVEMPRPVAIERLAMPMGGEETVVFFPGIAHVITEKPMEKADAEMLAPIWCGYLDADALGIMAYDRETSRLTPLVYVPGGDTLFWESSCASGTAALGYFLRQERGGGLEAEISEPGGTLRISVTDSGALSLTGSVRIVYKREAEI